MKKIEKKKKLEEIEVKEVLGKIRKVNVRGRKANNKEENNKEENNKEEEEEK